jgi:hypothetical protein
MICPTRASRVLAVLSLVVSLPVAAHADDRDRARFIRSVDRMMAELSRHNARTSNAIRQAYAQHLPLLVIDQYAQLERALWNGGLAPLPANPLKYNLAPRLTGYSPIGEKDLDHQVSYIAARPSTIGALLDVASRVTSGPLEITSLVRHTEYQGALRSTNVNATTSVPMHTMGLAFDIALVNTPLETVYEIRDVLLARQAAGDLQFIGERRQLVFHVVPNPARLGHFSRVYASFFGSAPASDAAHVVAFSSDKANARPRGRLAPNVTAEVITVLPTEEHLKEWWRIDHADADLTVVVAPEPIAAPPPPAFESRPSVASLVAALAIAGALAGLTWRVAISRPALALLRV